MLNELKLKQEICPILPKRIVKILEEHAIKYANLQEIRLRAEKPLFIIYKNEEWAIKDYNRKYVIVSKKELKETMDYVSRFSLYAFENEIREGFLTINGGHRVGVAGQTIIVDKKVKNIKCISSVNIRITHEVKGCADKILPYICRNGELLHTLIISPPRAGKTTILRDIIRQASTGGAWTRGTTVGVVDERSEIAGCYMGIAQNDVGIRTDILDCCPKVEGMMMLIRSMSPNILAVDEIGTAEDIKAVEYARCCGCTMLATAHGLNFAEMKRKPIFDCLIQGKRFQRYVVLSNRKKTGNIEEIVDENGTKLW